MIQKITHTAVKGEVLANVESWEVSLMFASKQRALPSGAPYGALL